LHYTVSGRKTHQFAVPPIRWAELLLGLYRARARLQTWLHNIVTSLRLPRRAAYPRQGDFPVQPEISTELAPHPARESRSGSTPFNPFPRAWAACQVPRTPSVSHVSRRTQARQGRTLSIQRRACPGHPQWRCRRALTGVSPGHRQVDLDHAAPPVQGDRIGCQGGDCGASSPESLGHPRRGRNGRTAAGLTR
jgi:hypothetical protein